MEQKIKNFWDDMHQNEYKPSLSGCKLDYTIELLKLNDLIKPNTCILEIGVGLGYVTKELFEMGVKVSAVDISEIGLEKVKPYCENTYNINNVTNLPSNYFDFIICAHVVQHTPTDILIIEIKEFMRSLKNTGIIAIQFISSNTFLDNGINASYDDCKAGRICRTPEYMENIFKQFGGKCTLVYSAKMNVLYLTGNHVFHVRK